MNVQVGKTALLIGATGGIGRAWLEQLLLDPAVARILATARVPVSSIHPRIRWLQLDLADLGSIQACAEQIVEHAPALDWFLSASGVLHDGALQPEKRLARLDSAQLAHVYQVNAAGPLAVLAGCEKSLRAAEAARVLLLSAQVGSIEDNRTGGWYAYRMAKAALNQGLRCAAIESRSWRRPPVMVAVHPGTTHSELSRPFVARRQGVSTAVETADRLHGLLGRLEGEDNGSFLSSHGERLAW